jgi:pyruvate-formate lyase-activating enzyme
VAAHDSVGDVAAGSCAAEQLAAIVNATYDSEEGRDIIGTGENDPGVCFAGFGEPLLRLDTLRETVRLVRETRHGIPWRINTNGLHGVEVAQQVAEFAVDHDGRHPFVVSVMLAAHTPPAYAKQMKPVGDRGFNDVCNFVMALSEAGVTVEATAVAATGTYASAGSACLAK